MPRAKPRTPREKLTGAATHARTELMLAATERAAAGAARVAYPSAALSHAFRLYSDALRKLVAYHLAAPEWEMAQTNERTTSWRWDEYERVFRFDYDGWADLPHAVDDVAARRAPRMRCVATLELDPEKPLDEELDRLAGEAAHLRSCVDLMEQEVLRHAVRAEATQGAPS